jgi:cysteinyl-tRNA synthetase
MLSTHYRQPIDFSVNALEQSMIALRYFKTFSIADETDAPSDEFMDALLDDLNTPRAIAELHRLLNIAREGTSALAGRMSRPGAMLDNTTYAANRQIAAGLRMLGIDIENYDPDFLQKQRHLNLSARTAARARKDFGESDRIRDQLAAMGIVIKDSKDGTTWEVAR